MRPRLLRRFSAALGSALTLLLGACHDTPSPATAVEAALAHYARLATEMAHDSIAALFTSDGELAAAGQATITGPDAIRAHLRSFVGYHVLANELIADTTRASADTAYQVGSYRQRVQVPAGDTVEVHGRFDIVWIHGQATGWRIRRMATRPPG